MIFHLDLDAFFASCERVDNPQWRGVPLAVGGRGDPFIFSDRSRGNLDATLQNGGAFVPSLFYNAETDFRHYFVENGKIRGIVITASYEARACGVQTGMTIREALARCPRLIVRPPRHLLYHERSHALKEWLKTRVPVLEQYSIDEFFGDLSGWVPEQETPRFLRRLKEEAEATFGLPVSIGAAPSKWIAKMATAAAKPGRGDGVRVLFAHEIDAFVDPLPIEAFPGIGRGFEKRLRRYKIETLGELKSAKHLLYRWKQPGRQLYHRVNGDDNEPVIAGRDRRSIGISRTIDPVHDRREIRRRLIILCRHLAHLVERLGVQPRTVSLVVKYQFGQKTKRRDTGDFVFSETTLRDKVLRLFEAIGMMDEKVEITEHQLLTIEGVYLLIFSKRFPTFIIKHAEM